MDAERSRCPGSRMERLVSIYILLFNLRLTDLTSTVL